MFFQALNPETLTGSGSALRDAEVNAQLLVRFRERTGDAEDKCKISYFTFAELRDPLLCPVWWDASVYWFCAQSYADAYWDLPLPDSVENHADRYNALVEDFYSSCYIYGSRLHRDWSSNMDHWDRDAQPEIQVDIVINVKENILRW
ncbi:MAG: hypothetical protein IT284_00170 [Bacteroidetes bacterium]|nr:hypothetical protein [Bacteroidota bacterium]